MISDTRSIEITQRDLKLLRILARGPHNSVQLLRLTTFPNLDKLWRRLRLLQQANLVTSWPYAPMVDRSNYFKLTRHAYRLLFLDEPLPTDAFFNETKLGSHQHTYAIAEFATLVEQGATESDWELLNFRRDRDIEINAGETTILPDAFFQLRKDDRTLNIILEVDCGTEPVRSTRSRESLQKKILAYDRLAKFSASKFRAFFLFTTSQTRMNHFLETVNDLIEQPKTRTPFLATTLDDVISTRNVAIDPVFRDHRHESHSVLLPLNSKDRKPASSHLIVGSGVW